MTAWATRLGLTREALLHSLRTAIAAVVSSLLARALKLPEFYWAPISTIVILLSAIRSLHSGLAALRRHSPGRGPGRPDRHLRPCQLDDDWMVYGAGILVCGILSALLRLGGAYRFAAITLTIVLLIAHTASARGSSPITASWKYRSESRWRCWSQRSGACQRQNKPVIPSGAEDSRSESPAQSRDLAFGRCHTEL